MDVIALRFGHYQLSLTQLFSALGLILALVIALWNSGWQSRLQRRQLRQAMFDRRFAVYETVLGFLRHVCEDFQVGFPEIIGFAQATNHAKFLFEPSVQAFISEVFQSANRLHVVTQRVRDNPGDQNSIDEMNRFQRWFTESFTDADKIFTPYLKLYGGSGPGLRSRAIGTVTNSWRRLVKPLRRQSSL